MKEYRKQFLKIFGITLLAGVLFVSILFGGAVLGFWGGIGDLDVDALTLQQNSTLVYFDPETGEEKELTKLNAQENREWAEITKIPKDLQHAFVAIEDERFYTHKGYDLKRTAKATISWIGRKITGKSGVSMGGSTITQQLIKNITGDKEQVASRKIKEISRAVALEKEMSKDQILELYLNCIYLSQGCNGVQTASGIYFNKDVSELSLAECASLAGITQYPSLYDPFVNPEKNKERQELVLGKMLELSYITQDQYQAAIEEPLKFADRTESRARNTGTTSYFVDQVIRDVLKDLKAEGYSESLANKILYSGGVKIYTTYVPQVQEAVEAYFENTKNFPDSEAQSAITVVDVQTGQIAGIAGGIGEKSGSLTLNRASMSPRQPGSSIKPIAVYAPALEKELITPASIFQDEKKSYGDWTPKNSDNQYRGAVDIRHAVRRSLNTIAVQVLAKVGAQESFHFLRDNLGITTLVEGREGSDGIISDIGYSQLALGGLTDGVTTMEMAAAYAAFANDGVYHSPYIYTEVKDKDGNLLLTSKRTTKAAMKSSTAFLMTRLLNEVVTSGTGSGAALPNGIFTAGKTGTTDDNYDRWFIGFTPYYSAAIWYGYDIPREIYASGNPCVTTFRSVMSKAHQNLSDYRKIVTPNDVVYASYCPITGKGAGEKCPAESYYFVKGKAPGGTCTDQHENLQEEGEEGTTEDSTENNGTTPTPSSSSAPTATSPTKTTTPSSQTLIE